MKKIRLNFYFVPDILCPAVEDVVLWHVEAWGFDSM